jgi:hypothetical protein
VTLLSQMSDIFPPPPSHGAIAPSGAGPPHHRRFTITLRHTKIGRNPLEERSARRKDLSVTADNTDIHVQAGFEPAIPANDRRPTP